MYERLGGRVCSWACVRYKNKPEGPTNVLLVLLADNRLSAVLGLLSAVLGFLFAISPDMPPILSASLLDTATLAPLRTNAAPP